MAKKIKWRKLGMIVPFYNETPAEMEQGLMSVNGQLGVVWTNFKMYLVNDGNGNHDIEEYMNLHEWNFDYEFIYMDENGGPGMARQEGIDSADDCAYVIFMDADDCLSHQMVLHTWLINIDVHKDAKVFLTKWYEEQPNKDREGEMMFILHDWDFTWMHGICYDRMFLYKNDITHEPSLRVHEDSYFNAIAAAKAGPESWVYIDDTTYVWKYRESSIVRRNDSLYTYESAAEFFRSIRMAYEKVNKFAPESMQERIVQMAYYGYYSLINSDWEKEENAQFFEKTKAEFKKTINKFKKYLKDAPYEMMYQIKNNERIRQIREEESMTFPDFLKSVGINVELKKLDLNAKKEDEEDSDE